MMAINVLGGLFLVIGLTWGVTELVFGWPRIIRWAVRRWRRMLDTVARVSGRGLAWVPGGREGCLRGMARLFRWKRTVGFSLRRAFFVAAQRGLWRTYEKSWGKA